MICTKKIKGYTLLELLIVMALSVIIVSMLFMALFLVQKQIESNKDDKVYDQTLLMNIIDHHLFECQDIIIDKQTITFKYPTHERKIIFSAEQVYLSKNDSLPLRVFIENVAQDKMTGLLEHFEMKIQIGNEDLLLMKKPSFSNSHILNYKFINFEY